MYPNRVAFVLMNPRNRYSGGRIHALWLAYAFAANGYEVDYFTNCIPVFSRHMPEKYKDMINFKVNKYFMWRSTDNQYQHVILVPHLASLKSEFVDKFLFYPFASNLKKKNNCLLWFLDFESPNWIQQINPTLRSMSKYRNSNKIIKDCDIILSTTKTGLHYAEKYFKNYNKNLRFFQLYLAINTSAAEGIDYYKKENMALFFARFGQKHKNNEALFNIVESLPTGYHLAILGNRNAANAQMIRQFENLCKLKGIFLSYHKNINDKEKFELLAKTKIVFFSSKFEGYGIPPLEAQYMGVSVICSDLPVLREVNPMATFVNFSDKFMLSFAIKQLINNPKNPDKLRKGVEAIALPEIFFKNLGTIIKEVIK